MSVEHDITDEEIAAALDRYSVFASDDHGGETVSRKACAEWRDRRAAGEGPATIARDVQWASATVATHIRGDCSHDHETDGKGGDDGG